MACHNPQCGSLNCPEENDETLSEESQSDLLSGFHNLKTSPHDCRRMEGQPFGHQHYPTLRNLSRPPHDHLFIYNQQTPYPSQADPKGGDSEAHCDWNYTNYHSRNSEGSYTNSLPSYLPSMDYHSYPERGSFYLSGPHSLPGRHSPSLNSLEQPRSLHSFPSGLLMHSHHAMPFHGIQPNPPCCGHYGPSPLHRGHHLSPGPGYHLPFRRGPEHYRPRPADSTDNEGISPRPREASPCTTRLSQEQRKVFVTYEADSEDHLKEIIKFVALLRNNGFDTHIDVFEQQLNSISKIDCMERYLNEKDYLIIIIISLKYFETVTGANMSPECDERTSNTVYIHKQLQSEFIQNGCKNFRFIPVLFPGAKKSYVPTWLQNTHIYSWPKDRDDILRRLLRVEKYNPPPIGPLPTIVSVPI
ncbi:E3 ubiquitin ligase TRAF3IP2 [Astyanax mexicanus]|nr:E3 ubiquitin ligase TRAF3IP2 [Astyanax mexicanus]